MMINTLPKVETADIDRDESSCAPQSFRTHTGIEWEETSCLCCGHEHLKPIIEAADTEPPDGKWRFAIVECPRCSLWYTNPRPSPASIGRFYPETYKPHRKPRALRAKNSFATRMFAKVIGRPCAERHFIPAHGEGRLLDYGCGGGDFLLRMRDQGWNVTGLDISKKVIENLRTEHGLPGFVGSLAKIADGSFDVVTMWASLEHMHQPLSVLREVRRVLAPGGRLYIQVPNANAWNRRLFGTYSFSLDLPRHLTHFHPATLRTMLEK
ncbi:MAG: class I SAM-dependent methyltransferase, partial [Planctomycetes bacterium]|nr:class I SAM-dependent methyltransferase [Planctomycetota bacterium]